MFLTSLTVSSYIFLECLYPNPYQVDVSYVYYVKIKYFKNIYFPHFVHCYVHLSLHICLNCNKRGINYDFDQKNYMFWRLVNSLKMMK